MELNDIISFIEKIELFNGIKQENLKLIAQKAELKTFKAGELLFEEDAPRKEIFLIVEGRVDLFKTTAWGSEKKVTVFGSCDFLGEGSLMEDTPHSTSARVEVDTQVVIISAEFFKEYGDIAVATFSNIAKVISRRMRHANARAANSSAQYESGRTRQEHDLLGDREVPYEYYYGVQTLRALENFNISGITLNFFPKFIRALAMVKKAAALANAEIKQMPQEICDAICQACDEIIDNRFHHHFVVDMIQGGAGTSTNMNANEVIANRALEIMGKERGEYQYCHPNNHVNMAQSTNDAYPSAIKIALIKSNESLVKVLKKLIAELRKKGLEFADIIKMGRTQLQDAVPMTLGQSFIAFADTLEEDINILNFNAQLFEKINMGGTAIGTGICAHPEYRSSVIKHMKDVTQMDMKLASNLVAATPDTGDFVIYSSAIKRLAIKLSKICNDLRLMSSGPRAGINEINLPPMQPGSSIMPGKVNPVIPEVVNQIAFKVIGNDLTVAMAAEAGQLELNVMEPVIVQSIFESIEMLKNGMSVLNRRCVKDITANEAHCKDLVNNSIGLVTALNPYIGYENSTMIAKDALENNRSVYDLVLEHKLLTKEKLDTILDPKNMIQ